MADDVSRLLGRLEAGFEAVIDRVNRSDEQTAQKFNELSGQHETDKREAIQARNDKEAREEARFKGIDEKLTHTYGMASVALKWIDEKGDPLVTRVSNLEQARVAAATAYKIASAEKRGGWKAWAAIGGIITTAVSLLIAYGKDLLEMVRSHG